MTLRIFSRSLPGLIFAGLATSAMAQNATQTRLLSLQSPSPVGAPVTLRAEIDGLGGGAPTGWATFWDGTTRIGWGKVSAAGAGQATLKAGGHHSCALTAAGALKCWGSNYWGQLGDGTTTIVAVTPVAVTGLWSGVVAIAAGGHHSCALTGAGGVKCWGYNSSGQVGDGTTTGRLTPVAVSGLSSGVVSIAAGLSHSCALTAAGGVKCWGVNGLGQLGDGTRSQRLTPVAVTELSSGSVAIAAGDAHSCVLTGAGGVKCWGSNGNGQIGDGSSTDWKLKPVDVAGLSSGVVAIAGGESHNCALTAAGRIKCWGANGSGQLGDGASTDMYTPVRTQNITGLVRARAEFATPPLPYGPHWLRAYYRGDDKHAPSLGGVRQWAR